MCRWITVVQVSVLPQCDQFSVANDDCTDRNFAAFSFDQSRGARLRSCGLAPATGVSFFRGTLPPQTKIGPTFRGKRPDSQFFTVPNLYRISVTMSRVFLPIWKNRANYILE